MKRLSTRSTKSLLAITAISLLMPVLSASAGEKTFPHVVGALDNSYPEGFAIGKGHTAYNGSVDGSIYKVDLRSGKGEVLNPNETPDPWDCLKLGMRVDSRTNYLFVAGCIYGNAYVYDADSGDVVEEYQLGPGDQFALINDVTITKDAAYFTDSFLPYIYRLPLGKNGALPPDSDSVTRIDLPDEFILDPDPETGDPCCGGNGIVSTPNGKTLIIGHSNLKRLYRVDPATGDVDEIVIDPPLRGDTPDNSFIDGLVLKNRTLYVLNPQFGSPDEIQVVQLDKGMRTGALVGIITDEHFNGVASGALFGKSLYVNNAHYDSCCVVEEEEPYDLVLDEDDNPIPLYPERTIIKLNRHSVEPVE